MISSLPASLRLTAPLPALCFLLALVALARAAPSFLTVFRRSSVSVSDRPPRRGLPRADSSLSTDVDIFANSPATRVLWHALRAADRGS